MKLIDLLQTKKVDVGVMAFGFFDCIHLGHQKVISEAVRLAKEIGCVSSVFLFRNNIFPLLGIKKYPIYTFEERVSFIEELGVDNIVFVEADKNYLSLSPQGFLSDLLNRVSLKGFSCGKDFTFGKDGKGDVNDLISAIGGVYSVSDLLEYKKQKVSTERVKKALNDGDLHVVRACLGRDLSVKREVLPGRKEGAKIGFPTINTPLLSLPLKEGVYFTSVTVDGKTYRSVTNVGPHPTFDDYSGNIETHLLDFDGDLYGKEVKIDFLSYHRQIKRFNTVSDLIECIRNDVKERRHYD